MQETLQVQQTRQLLPVMPLQRRVTPQLPWSDQKQLAQLLLVTARRQRVMMVQTVGLALLHLRQPGTLQLLLHLRRQVMMQLRL